VLGAVLSRAERRAAEQRDTIARQQAELERALAEARAANEAKSVFLATISHELRTPLSGVLGLTELLLLTHLEPRQREFLETVQSSGASLVTLINDLLDLSKAEAGRLEVERVPVDVAREVAEVARLFTGRAQGKQLALETKWLGDPPPVLLGDGLRLRQVLSNLVSNALKFTARGGVTLACRATRDGARWALRLDVVDTGPGIDAATRARLVQALGAGGHVRQSRRRADRHRARRSTWNALVKGPRAEPETGRGRLTRLRVFVGRSRSDRHFRANWVHRRSTSS